MQEDLLIRIKTSLGDTKSKIKEVTGSFTTLGRNTKQTSGEFSKFYNNTRKMNNMFSNITKDANRASDSFKNVSRGMKGLNQVIDTSKIYLASDIFSKSIQSAFDMIEVTHLFSVSMGDTAVKANELVVAMQDAYGLDPTNLQSSIGTFNLLARSMGLAEDQAHILSTNTAKLAVDLSSLYNVPINQVMADLRSGLVGQSETVYKYGMDVTEAGLKTEALNQGITKSVRDMNQGEKMALRYSVMIKRSGLSHGDFAKTIDQPANQLKILGERFVTLTRTIGTMFEPALRVVLPYLNALVKVLTTLISRIAMLFGYTPPKVENTPNGFAGVGEDASDAGDAIDGATKAVKKFKAETLGIDELNILGDGTSDSGSGASGAGGGGGGMVAFDLPSYDNMMSGIKSKTTEIEASINKLLAKFGELSKPITTANWDILKISIKGIVDALKPLGKTIGSGLEYFYKNVLVPIGVWVIEKGVPAVFNAFASALEAVDAVLIALAPTGKAFVENVLKPIGEFVGDAFITVMETIIGSLEKFTKWVKENEETVRTITKLVIGFFLGWKTFNIVSSIITAFGTAMAVLTSPVGLVVLAIIALIAIIVLLVKNWDTIKEVAKKVWDKVVSIWSGVKEWFNTYVAQPLADAFDKIASVWNDMVSRIKNLWENFKTMLSSVKKWFNTNVTQPLADAFDKIASMWNNMVLKIKSVWKNLQDGFNTFKTNFKKGWVDFWENGLGSSIKGFGRLIVRGVAGAMNGIIKVLNAGILGFNNAKSALGISGWTYPIKLIDVNSISQFASGGFPDMGQMFIANEAGPELVGNLNGKPAVVNNDQIVQAVSQGVAQAVASVMGGSSSDAPVEITLQVGSTEFGKVAIDSINKLTRQSGKVLLQL